MNWFSRSALLNALLSLALLPAQLAFAADSPHRAVVFTHVNVIPMDREIVLADQNVVVVDGKISTVGPSSTVKIPKGAKVIDGSGKYLMPGLADMHVHLYFPPELTLNVVHGVTTVFNLNGQPGHLHWRAETASGALLGPTIYSVGPTFDHPRTAEEAVKVVDQISADGYDGVKIYNQVSKAEYPALIAEAKRKNLIIIGHIAREPGFALTLQSGQSIAHAEEYLYTFFNDDSDPDHDLTHPLDASKIPQAVAMTKEAGVSLVATLVAYHNIVRQLTDLPAYLRAPEFQYLAPSMFAGLQPGDNGYQKKIRADEIPHMQPNYEFQKKLVRALHDGGVPILAGTDVAWLGVPGFSLIEEVENFQEIGFTPYAALRTATADPAIFLKHNDEFGTVSVGKRADLLLLTANPLNDVHNLRERAGVMVRGRWIDSAECSKLLAAVPESYRKTDEMLLSELHSDPKAADKYLAENDPYGEQSGALLLLLTAQPGADKPSDLLLGIKKENPNSPLVAESTVNAVGYELWNHKKTDEALEVFKLNTLLHPESGNTFDSLAETYLNLGNKEMARINYQKALEVQPDYGNAQNARNILAKLK